MGGEGPGRAGRLLFDDLAPERPVPHPIVHLEYPSWVDEVVDFGRPYPTDESRMRLAIAVARANVERGTGGPFGAAIVESASGRLVSVGMNSVVRLENCTLHGEMVAFMMAQRRVGSFTLAGAGLPAHELVTRASRARCASVRRSGAA